MNGTFTSPVQSSPDFYVEEWLVEPSLNRLSRGTLVSHLEPKAMQVLVCLSQTPGKVVSKHELISVVWPDTFVTEQVLTRAVWLLRQAFGEQGRELIQNVPKGGYRLIAVVRPREAAASEHSPHEIAEVAHRGFHRPGLYTLVVCTGLAVVALTLYFAFRQKDLSRPPVIAVLPFENLSGDAAQEYLSDGLTEEMVSQIGHLSAKDISVIGRASTMAYKGSRKPVERIARELSADFVLTGSIRQQGPRIRVSAHLLSGKDSTQLWTENYEQDRSDILLLESDIASNIAQTMRARFGTEILNPSAAQAVDWEAYNNYLKGNYELAKRQEDDFATALHLFKEAVQRDPTFARAYVGEGLAYLELAGWHSTQPGMSHHAEALASAERALQLDPQLAEAHILLARIRFLQEWDWAGAEQEFRRGVQLNPSETHARVLYENYLAAMGRFEEVVEFGRRTIEMDPANPGAYDEIMYALVQTGHREEAIQFYQRSRRIDPYFYLTPFLAATYIYIDDKQTAGVLAREALSLPHPLNVTPLVAAILAKTGEKEEANRILRDFEKQGRGHHISPGGLAMFYASIGQQQRALDFLEQGFAEHDHSMIWLKHPFFAPLRSEPRFETVWRRMNFPN
jgi:TolB-like protein/DNA-binding winged helix-turn-helix (wHTH) protein